MGYADSTYGEYTGDYLEIGHSPDGSSVKASSGLRMTGSTSKVDLSYGAIEVNANFRPTYDQVGAISLGTRGANGERRFKNVNITGSVDSSSDARLKKDICPLSAFWILDKLKPRRFRMIADDKKLRFGFIAQEVAEVLQNTDVADAEFFDDENPEHLSLCYGELIAVLVEGYQNQQTKIEQLEARIARLEALIHVTN